MGSEKSAPWSSSIRTTPGYPAWQALCNAVGLSAVSPENENQKKHKYILKVSIHVICLKYISIHGNKSIYFT